MKWPLKSLEARGNVLAFGTRLTGFLAHELGQVFSVILQEFFSSAHTIASEWDQTAAKKARWSKKQGVYRTTLIFPEAFEGVERAINQPFSVHRFRVSANPSQCQMLASCGWHEEVPGFAFTTHQLDLILDFEAQPNGTDVRFEWLVNDFPKSMFADQYIRTINSWIESALGVDSEDE